MKKFNILAVAVICGATLISCDGGSSKKQVVKSESLDSLTYAYGVAMTQGLKPYLQQMGVDTTDLSGFIKGLKEGFKTLEGKDKDVAVGRQIGQQLKEQMFANVNTQMFGQEDTVSTLSEKIFLEAFIKTVEGKETKMTKEQATKFLETNEARIKNETLAQKPENKKAIEDGKKFLEANAKKGGVQTTKSGLQYKVITQGTGEKPNASAKVKVIYKGTLIDGTVFDESQKDSAGVIKPTELNVQYVVKGWQEALQLMPKGSKWLVYLPYDIAYGSQAAGEKIKPFSTLIFEMELIDVENPAPAVPAKPSEVEVLQ